MVETKRLALPLDAGGVAELTIGEHVALSGALYTARDAAHRRMVAMLDAGDELPIDLRGQTIYYVGPTPAREGEVIGSAGPTTAMRMDPFTPRLLEAGLLGMIGKGGRGAAVREAIARHGAVYLMAVGGTGALLQRHIRSAEVVAFEDLGTEAIRRLEVVDLPVIVAVDSRGRDLLAEGKARYRTSERPIPAEGAVQRDGGGGR